MASGEGELDAVPAWLTEQTLKGVELDAQRAADELQQRLTLLKGALGAMADVTASHEAVWKESVVEGAVNTMDGAVEKFQTFIARVDELHAAMGPIEEMAADVKEMRRQLTVLEKDLKLI